VHFVDAVEALEIHAAADIIVDADP